MNSVRAEELAVQLDQLPQEPPIGIDAAVLLHRTNGLHQGQVLLQHQVGQHQRGRAAHSNVAVHQNLAWGSHALVQNGTERERDLNAFY